MTSTRTAWSAMGAVVVSVTLTSACASVLGIDDPSDRVVDPSIDAAMDGISIDASPGDAGNDTASGEGGCGPCPINPNVSATSCGSDGGCMITDCDKGHADCNGVFGDGCETNTATSHDTCGSCVMACGGAQVCEDGGCASTCSPGTQTQCTGGCVTLTTDPDHCGTCTNFCPRGTGGNPSCDGGACRFTCSDPTNFADCDSNPLNGCESLGTPAHCGSCAACSTLVQAVATCTPAKTCTYACNPGHADCLHSPTTNATTTGCSCDLSVWMCSAGSCVPIDSGVTDSGTIDSGVTDSGTIDSGMTDSGIPFDAGTTMDSGIPTDSGGPTIDSGTGGG